MDFFFPISMYTVHRPASPNMQNIREADGDRTITSAIHNMSVAEVRKALSFMRKEWTKHSCVMPFFPCHILPGSALSVSEFAFRFVMGHHHKRHQKQVHGA